ncbi:MAG: hypothetical protein ACLRVN_01820 [Butyricicoccus sp.]
MKTKIRLHSVLPSGRFLRNVFDDAKLVSRELELTLTGRDCGQENVHRCAACRITARKAILPLVQKGYKIAICEQMEDPKKAKGLVKREIIRRVTPGTVVEASMLDETGTTSLGCVYALRFRRRMLWLILRQVRCTRPARITGMTSPASSTLCAA